MAETVGQEHADGTLRAWKVAEARAKMENGEYEKPDVVKQTAIILRRTLAFLDASEARLPYQGRDKIVQGDDDQRDQT